MDLSKLSITELRDLLQKIPLELTRRENQEKIDALNELRAFAKTRGFSLEELIGKETKMKVSGAGKVKVKYRHPQNAELEWTGRGRTPKWVSAWVDSGGSMDMLLV